VPLGLEGVPVRLLALQATKAMTSLLIDRLSRDVHPKFWCKGQPGSVLSLLQEDLYYVPVTTAVSWVPMWKETPT
jgi:hypothetical protein